MAQATRETSTTRHKRRRLQTKALALADRAQRTPDPTFRKILEDEALRTWQAAHRVHAAAAAQVLAEIVEAER